MKATIFDIQRGSFVDGEGIRTTIFFKGCNLRCKWCHNPEGLENVKEMLFYKDKCTGCKKCIEICKNTENGCTMCGKCALYCPNGAREIAGKEYTIAELLNEILKDKAYYENSNGGVTFSGGECMLQIDFLTEILKQCHSQGINTAIDTAGNVPYEYFERILPYTDTFLYDVKCITNSLHKEGTGVKNNLILDNLVRLLKTGAQITVRVPLIGGFNDTEEELAKIKAYLKKLSIKNVEYLPYHEMAEHKYNALNILFTKYQAPNKEVLGKALLPSL